ncbi:chondroitinase-B domain-containing protein [Roseibium sp. Sym1]|uniref:chondroitinase-B domain-containing protein n=1 Tax=Roseibium sp. Sym1 TaxID=3016006 RepID=UPI0022B4B2EE|nr:chondroitinase-B domain-containing protein [Roseibium sp. Sym1]
MPVIFVGGGEYLSLGSSFFEQLEPGTDIVIREGTYTDVNIDVPEGLNSSGDQPIRILAESGNVTFTGNVGISLAGDYTQVSGFTFKETGDHAIDVYGDGVEISGNSFIDCGDAANTGSHIVQIHSTAQNTVFSGNEVSGSTSITLKIRAGDIGADEQPTGSLVENNYFHDIERLSDNGQEVIQIAGPDGSWYGDGPQIDLQTVIQNNTFYRTNGDVEVISIKVGGNTVSNNLFLDMDAAPTVRNGGDNIIEDNVLVETRPIRLFGTGTTVEDNIIVNPTQAGLYIGNGSETYQAATDNLVTGNLVYSEGSINAVKFSSPSGEEFTIATGNDISGNNFIVPEGVEKYFYFNPDFAEADYIAANDIAGNVSNPDDPRLQTVLDNFLLPDIAELLELGFGSGTVEAPVAIYDGNSVDGADWYQFGSDADETLVGSAGTDFIYGGLGDDRLYGKDGADSLSGGSGTDYIDGGTGNDTVDGGEGDDRLIGREGDDTLLGGAGNDYLNGGLGNDIFHGGVGNDKISAGLGADILWGEEDDDALYGREDDDILYGGTGDDYLSGDEGNDTLHGDEGSDTLKGRVGDDTLYGGSGDDRLEGGDGEDVLYGGDSKDLLFGNAGNDVLFGEAGEDRLGGGGGDDELSGGGNNDVLYGNDGFDRLDGGAGNDYLSGGNGDDVLLGADGYDFLYGGADADQLTGGMGRDELQGGSGADTFVFLETDDYRDTVLDFKSSENDRLDLSDFFAGLEASAGELFDSYIGIRSTSIGTIVSVLDPAGEGGPVDVALLSNHASLDMDSFIF